MTDLHFSEHSVKAIIFDCDGTLVDSEGAHLLAWKQTLQTRGVFLTPEQCCQSAGKSDTEIARISAENMGSLHLMDKLLKEKNAHYDKLLKQGAPAIEETLDFLKRVASEKKRLGLKLGLASAAIKHDILGHLRYHEIESLFDVILSGHDDLKDYCDPEGVNKPKPYIYLHAAKLLGVAPTECVVIEDSKTGVLSSKAAGCFTIAIPNQITKMHDLSAADLEIKTLSGMTVDQFLQIVRENKEKFLK